MTYRVTPLAMNRGGMMANPLASLAHGERHTVMRTGDYDERQTLDVDAETAHDALERTWTSYQNIDEDRQTPDRKRSLMTGDMARVEGPEGISHWVCCSIGWHETVAPGDAVQEFGR